MDTCWRRFSPVAGWPSWVHPYAPAYAEPVAEATPAAEVVVDGRLVRRLLRSQHADLAELPLRPLGTGWDNVVYRLGPDLTVRLPRRELGARLIESELRWLPELAERLPLAVPTPVRPGQPGEGYPWRWAVCRFVPGRSLGPRTLAGPAGLRAAERLAGFLAALHVAAPDDAPRSPFRGVSLAQRDDSLRAALEDIPPHLRIRLQQAWSAAVQSPAHRGPDLWLHGDLHGLNLLRTRDRLTGVIDFGDLCAGDPATDLAVGWLALDRPARAHLRQVLAPEESAWARGRGWALFLGVMFLAHSRDSPVNRDIGNRALREVLADRG